MVWRLSAVRTSSERRNTVTVWVSCMANLLDDWYSRQPILRQLV
jgi:hypothetical protein